MKFSKAPFWREGSHMQGLTTELANAVFMATKLAGDINVYDYRVREFEKIYQ